MSNRWRTLSLPLVLLCSAVISHGPGAEPLHGHNPCSENPCNPCGGGGSDPWADGAAPPIYEGDEGLRRLIELRRSLDEAKHTAGDETLRETLDREDQRAKEVEFRVLGRERPELESHPHDAWARLLRVTHDNPLVSEQCRLDALTQVGTHFAEHADGDPAAHYLAQQRDYVANTRGGQDALTAEIIAHIESCPDFCLPFLGHLLRCHVETVAASEPTIVFFPVDEDRVSRDATASLDGLARDLLRKRRNVILFGSASNLGDTPAAYDDDLSLRRAVSVKNALVGAGVPIDRIRVKWLGWQEPRLSGRRLASKWGVEDLLDRVADLEHMNQNVVAVAY